MPKAALVLLGVLVLAGCGGGDGARQDGAVARSLLPGRDLDPSRLPSLPAQGLVVARRAGLVLAGLDGEVIGHLGGFRVDVLTEQGRHDRVVYVQDGQRREWTVGATGLRRASRPEVVPYPPGYDGCDRVAAAYLICGRPGTRGDQTSRVVRLGPGGRRSRVVGPAMRTAAGVAGRWVGVYPAPGGRALLLQWSSECEIPQAYLASASGGNLRPVADVASTQSVALGWTRRGRALVSVARGDCGRGAALVTYAIDPAGGSRTRIVRGEASLWGDASVGVGG